VKKENGEDLALLKDNQFPLEIDAEQAYEELEVADFNQLFANHCLIQEKFGPTIKVELKLSQPAPASRGFSLSRKVKEYPELVKLSNSDIRRSGESSSKRVSQESHKDPHLINIHTTLKQLEA
jgi:hypothetical protein